MSIIDRLGRNGYRATVRIVSLSVAFWFAPIGMLFQAEAQPENAPSISLQNPFATHPHNKQLPDWNKRHYDWNANISEDGLARVIVSLDASQFDSLSYDLKKSLLANKGHSFKLGFSGISTKLAPDTIEKLLRTNPDIQIQPDMEVHATVAVNQTGADAMWNRTDASGNPLRGDGIVVAVLDTGIDYNHPALGGPGAFPTARVIGGYDYYNEDSNPMDDNGHGSHCAGIIGANGTIFGMAPSVKFLAYKVLNSQGTGYMSDTTAAIERATDPNNDGDTSDHADVISLSLGGVGTPTDSVCLAANEAMSIGAPVSRDDSGWTIALTDTLLLRVSAVGLLVSGMSLFASAMYFPDAPIISRRGRYVIGSLLIGIAAYSFIFGG